VNAYAPRALNTRTREDYFALAGSFFGSLATTWLLYCHVLPLSGKVGFVIAWYLLFVLFFAGVTSLAHPRAIVIDRAVSTAVIAAPTLVACALVSMLIYTVAHGLRALLHPNFYTQDMSGVRPLDSLQHGGILHAIVGTAIMLAISIAISLPLGIATAIYLSEVRGRVSVIVRSVIEGMTALPSIVAGLFIYSTLRVHLGVQASGFAAALALSVMGLPIMARASDVVLRMVPGGLREASLALGAGKWQTVWRVVLPTARPGLATALILSIARMVGETSPLLLTTGASTFFNANPFVNPMNSLPLFVFSAVRSGEPTYVDRGYGAATVLLVLVLLLFLLARLIARPRKVR
jgi:phosphate transport system permease protein